MVLAPPIEAHITSISKGHTCDITPQISFLQEVVDLTCVVSRYLPILTLENNFQTTFFERFVTNDDTWCVCEVLAQAGLNCLSDCRLTFFLRKEVHSLTSAQCILLGTTNYTTWLNQFRRGLNTTCFPQLFPQRAYSTNGKLQYSGRKYFLFWRKEP